MADRQNPPISSRRKPKQARSNDLVAAILEAALQVLEKEGAQRFTTTRVAERAGVSVGSVYQYFPNKASILFRLQSDEWKQTSDMLCGILEDAQRPPLERLRMLVHAFVRSECEEAGMRVALNDAAPLYRDAPEAHEARAAGDRIMQTFMRGLARRRRSHAGAGGRPDHDHVQLGGQAVLGKSAHRRGDQDLFGRHGRHVLRLPPEPRARPAEEAPSPTGRPLALAPLSLYFARNTAYLLMQFRVCLRHTASRP